ncbi:MAG: FecR family protein [Bacteroidota bacterium]|nr:FecR family protein [Bacteroidota bacterium]
MNQMISDINNILLIKYLRNDLNEAESKQVLAWLQEKEENKEFLFGLKEAYMLSRWKELQQQSAVSQGWDEFSLKIAQASPSKRSTLILSVVRYAAVAVIVFGLGFFLRGFSHQEPVTYNVVKTASGEHSTLILADGTKVRLNENSQLTYPSSFSRHFRKVSLKGEAYFEAAHNKKKPFLVNTSVYTVKVLGTKFNVDAYPDQLYVYTSLKEGKVQILDNSGDSKILSELKPGTQMSFNRRTGEYFVKEVELDEIGDWINGEVVFKRKTLQEIADKLEQKYGYTIDIRNKEISQLTYNITIENEPLEEILSDIHYITPQVHFSVQLDRKTVILN